MANLMRPVHPGEILRDELSVLNLSASAFAKALVQPTALHLFSMSNVL